MTDISAAADRAPQNLTAVGPELQDLPDSVRAMIVRWAARIVGTLPSSQIPPNLARVARFTPAKRGKLGAAALAEAVNSNAAFRAAVAEWAATEVAERTEDVAGVTDPEPDVDVAAAAVAFLLRLPTQTELLTSVRESVPAISRAQVERHGLELRRLQKELKTVTAERDALRSDLLATVSTGDEAERLRRRSREQGTRLRQAELTAQTRDARAVEELQSLQEQLGALRADVATWQDRARTSTERADRAQETLGRLREQTGMHKVTADRRLDLLLATVEGAASGLRREWELAGGGFDPADVVANRLPGPAAVPESTGDPSRLGTWLRLPSAHLIVDGYNVSKTGFPELTLAQQRDRLVRMLSALSARMSLEVTVVFDGADVTVPMSPGRGIRVLFSPSGVIADDVIRALAAAEPAGRVVVVVSSDREIADGVRRSGARTAGSGVLLALLS